MVTIWMRGLNSYRTCLQAPQGRISLLPGQKIAIALKSFRPAETALNTAARSAQQVRLNEMFSMLVPSNIWPFPQRRALPNLILE